MGYILLAGGAEFSDRMAKPDRRAIELAGGFSASISIIPAAAAPDNNHQRAAHNGIRWFKKLGAVNVAALPLIDRKSADDPVVVKSLQQSKMIYNYFGGFKTNIVGDTSTFVKYLSTMRSKFVPSFFEIRNFAGT